MALKKGHNSNNWWILPKIELYQYFMIKYLCIKYESNTLIFSKDIEGKPFFVCTDGQDVWRDIRMDSGNTICTLSHLMENGRGITP